MRARSALRARRARRARPRGGARRVDRHACHGDLLHQRARRGRDGGGALRLRGQLGRALLRPRELRRRRRLGGGRALGAGGGEARDDAVSLRLPRRDDGRQRPVAPRRGRDRVRLRAARGPPADAPLRARSGHRDLRRPRDHEQRPPLLREDRAGAEHVLVGARDHRSRAGRRRCARRDPGRVRVPAEPVRAPAPRHARGPGRGPCGRRLDLPATSRRVRALGRARRLRGRPLCPLPPDQRGHGLSRADLHHPRDARDRRRDEPLGRGRRRAGGERPRFRARERGERASRSSAAPSRCPQGRESWS